MIFKFSDYVFYTRVSRYDEAEVTLDEMKTGTSAYMKEDKIKQKFIATWNHLCQVVGVPSEIETTESDEDVSSGYNKTAYPEINRRVMRLLRLNKFPDHFDIVELIERCSAKHQLGISTTEKAQMSLLFATLWLVYFFFPAWYVIGGPLEKEKNLRCPC